MAPHLVSKAMYDLGSNNSEKGKRSSAMKDLYSQLALYFHAVIAITQVHFWNLWFFSHRRMFFKLYQKVADCKGKVPLKREHLPLCTQVWMPYLMTIRQCIKGSFKYCIKELLWNHSPIINLNIRALMHKYFNNDYNLNKYVMQGFLLNILSQRSLWSIVAMVTVWRLN